MLKEVKRHEYEVKGPAFSDQGLKAIMKEEMGVETRRVPAKREVQTHGPLLWPTQGLRS